MKVYNFLIAKPARFFFLAAILWGGLMCVFNSKDGANFQWHDILVEANGMFFDLLVFGILLSIYEALREKKEKIERLHEEIDDYREWPEKEAKFRLMGSVRRLIKEGEKKLNLRNCYLEDTSFADWNLSKTHFDMSNLLQAKFYQTILIGSTFQEAKLKNAAFYSADLTGADFSGADLEGVNFSKANLSNVTLEGAIVWPIHIYILEEIGQKTYPFGSKDWFRKLETDGVIGWEEIENKYYVDEFGILRLK
jgi:Pentapeptide repeats (9 copies)